jgi:hypothetical protein
MVSGAPSAWPGFLGASYVKVVVSFFVYKEKDELVIDGFTQKMCVF